MPQPILASVIASITEFKRDPLGTIQAGDGEAVAIIHQNKPAFYCLTPERYEALLDQVDDLELAEVARQRIESDEPSVAAHFEGDELVFVDSDAKTI